MKHAALLMMLLFIPFALFAIEGAAPDKSKADSTTAPLKVSFAGALWDGKKVPDGQQCQRFGGTNPATPRLKVEGIPAEANAIIMEYSDRSWPPMDNGGHGKIGYSIPKNTLEIVIPSVPGHTFDMPEGFFIIAPHQGPDWDTAGAYMPPCSGGMGNAYYVTIKAVHRSSDEDKEFKVLGQTVLELGIY